jgi:periplasmic mercuric ion binding protein
MKTLRIFPLITLFFAIANLAIAQKVKTETFKVSGECGMCKKKIETAAKNAGATYALWSPQTKLLKVTYASTTGVSVIQQHIAEAGYDTPNYKATDDTYNALDVCCQYERDMAAQTCCGVACDMKDGKCSDEAACKEKGCCKDSEKCKEMGCCIPGGKSSADAKSCCKKANSSN